MLMKYGTLTQKGARRNNEDYIQTISHPEENSWMGIVCDGMGGHSKGELASQTVAETITRYWEKHLNYKDDQTKVKKACQAAYRCFSQRAENIGNMEMGTTMVMASIQNAHLTIAMWETADATISEKKKTAFSKPKIMSKIALDGRL